MPRRQPTPLPVHDDGPTVLFGGTFDPVHRGHVTLGDAARRAAGDNAGLVFVPAARSPHKDRGPAASGADRTRMLAVATAELDRCGVWTEEIDRAAEPDGPSYWIDTLDAARSERRSDHDLRFVLGADQVLAFPRWHRWREILELAEPVVLAREPLGDAAALLDAMAAQPAWDGFDRDAWAARVVPVGVLPYSATAIRAALARGDDDIPGLDPRVHAYIRDRGLYA